MLRFQQIRTLRAFSPSTPLPTTQAKLIVSIDLSDTHRGLIKRSKVKETNGEF